MNRTHARDDTAGAGNQTGPSNARFELATRALKEGFCAFVVALSMTGEGAALVHEFMARVIESFPGGFEAIEGFNSSDSNGITHFIETACTVEHLDRIIQEAENVQGELGVLDPSPTVALRGLRVLLVMANTARALLTIPQAAHAPSAVPVPEQA